MNGQKNLNQEQWPENKKSYMRTEYPAEELNEKNVSMATLFRPFWETADYKVMLTPVVLDISTAQKVNIWWKTLFLDHSAALQAISQCWEFPVSVPHTVTSNDIVKEAVSHVAQFSSVKVVLLVHLIAPMSHTLALISSVKEGGFTCSPNSTSQQCTRRWFHMLSWLAS